MNFLGGEGEDRVKGARVSLWLGPVRLVAGGEPLAFDVAATRRPPAAGGALPGRPGAGVWTGDGVDVRFIV